VADGLAQRELAALDGQRSVLVVDQAVPATVGAGRLGTEGLGLLLQEGAEGALGQAGRRRGGHLLQRLEVDVRARAGLAEGATGDAFSPLGRQVTDFLDLLRREFARCHEPSCLVLRALHGWVAHDPAAW